MRLHDYMLGHARADAGRMAALDLSGWALAARIEQLRRHPLVGVLDDEVLGAIATGAIDPGAEARYLALRLLESEAEAAAEPPAGGHGGAAAGEAAAHPWTADLPVAALAQMQDTLRLVARGHLCFETLETRHRDGLDFRDCSVWSVRAALIEAYVEGWHAAG